MTAKTANKSGPAAHVKEGDGFNDVTLSRPATVGGAKVPSVRMREPTAGDVELFSNSTDSESTREINTFANLCMVTPDEVRALPFRDYVRLQASFALFTS